MSKNSNLGKKSNIIFYAIIIFGLMIFIYNFSFKFDLTEGRTFTLSQVSRDLVKEMEEDVTVKVFLSKNMPVPYNNLETSINDILSEYSQMSGGRFNYTIYDCTIKESDKSEEVKSNIEEAKRYGVRTVRVRSAEKGTTALTEGYIAMVIEYANIIEKIEQLPPDASIEFKITSILHRINNKINRFVQLTKNNQKIKCKLYFSPTLADPKSYIGFSKNLASIIDNLNREFVNTLSFQNMSYLLTNVNTNTNIPLLEKVQAKSYTDANSKIPQYAALVIEGTDDASKIELITFEMVLGKGGVQQQPRLLKQEELEQQVRKQIENVLKINNTLAYLGDNDTLELAGKPDNVYIIGAPASDNSPIKMFKEEVNKIYDLASVSLDEVSTKYPTLIIAGAVKPFTDWQLFQIDQYLMKGGNLIVFQDAFQEVRNNNPALGMYAQQLQSQFAPIKNNLEKLLDHYGIKIEHSAVLDTNCYTSLDGGRENNFYFVPKFSSKSIESKNFPFLKAIKFAYGVDYSPVSINLKGLESKAAKGVEILKTSSSSWTTTKPGEFRPGSNGEPPRTGFRPQPVIAMLEGSYSSYFENKGIPKKDKKDLEKKEKEKKNDRSEMIQTKINPNQKIIKKSVKDSKILVVGSSGVIRNGDDRQAMGVFGMGGGLIGGSIMILNLLDYVNGNVSWAEMRSKTLSYSPLDIPKKGLFADTTRVKTLNFIFPILFFGIISLIVFLRRGTKRKKVANQFKLLKSKE